MLVDNGSKVVTCDRDEKIRISRFPDAFNIHAYCLGHTEWVLGFGGELGMSGRRTCFYRVYTFLDTVLSFEERDRETDRQTEKERDTHRHRHTDKQTETEKERKRELFFLLVLCVFQIRMDFPLEINIVIIWRGVSIYAT